MKTKILGGIALLAMAAVITANINISLRGTKQTSEITMASIEARAGNDENHEVLKTFVCEDGNGSVDKCEHQFNASCDSNEDIQGYNSCSSGVGTTGNGYTSTSLCATQGHNYQTVGTEYKQCMRCNARVAINSNSGNNNNGSGNSGSGNNYYQPPHNAHNWTLISQSDGLWTWKCPACGMLVMSFSNGILPPTLGL
jgi:hypothetical protein